MKRSLLALVVLTLLLPNMIGCMGMCTDSDSSMEWCWATFIFPVLEMDVSSLETDFMPFGSDCSLAE